MTAEQWIKLSYLVQNGWPGEWDDDKSATYFEFLRGHEAQAVLAALHRMAQEAKPYRPTPTEIIGAINSMSADEETLPSWTEAWATILKGLKARDLEQGRAYVEKVHPVLLAFMDTEGWDKLRYAPFFGDHGALEQERLRQRWEAFCQVAKDRLKRGRTMDSLTGRGQFRRLDASVALVGVETGERKQIEGG